MTDRKRVQVFHNVVGNELTGNELTTLEDPAAGTVTSVGATAPITSSGGATPTIGITAATGAAAGSMSAADKAKLDAVAIATVSATAPITSSGGPAPAIGISAATGAAAGSMSAADKAKADLYPAASGALGNVLTSTGVAWSSAPAPGAASRVTPLDAHHIHAWELTEAAGDFADTGSSLSPVPLTVVSTAPEVYSCAGPLGDCPLVGYGPDGETTHGISSAGALTSLFTDLPAGDCTLEVWYRPQRQDGHLGSLFGVVDNASVSLSIDGNVAADQIALTARTALQFGNAAANPSWGPCSPNQWRYAAIVRSGADVRLYLDGEGLIKLAPAFVGSINWTRDPSSRIAIALGGDVQARGQFSRYRLSDIARTQAELRAVYKRGMGYS